MGKNGPWGYEKWRLLDFPLYKHFLLEFVLMLFLMLGQFTHTTYRNS